MEMKREKRKETKTSRGKLIEVRTPKLIFSESVSPFSAGSGRRSSDTVEDIS